MSRPKRRDVLRWVDSDGTEHESASWRAARGTSLANLQGRLVDAYCARGHLTASLVPGDTSSLVMVHNASTGPTAMLMLADGGLYAAFVAEGAASPIGEPRSSFIVECPSCLAGYVLEAEPLAREASRFAEKTRRIGLRAMG